MDGTCNIKLGDHREENIQTEGKLKRKLELRTNIQNPPREIGAFGRNHLESSKKLLSI
jgi:hypothetical protein